MTILQRIDFIKYERKLLNDFLKDAKNKLTNKNINIITPIYGRLGELRKELEMYECLPFQKKLIKLTEVVVIVESKLNEYEETN